MTTKQEREKRWWDTYNAAVTGLCARFMTYEDREDVTCLSGEKVEDIIDTAAAVAGITTKKHCEGDINHGDLWARIKNVVESPEAAALALDSNEDREALLNLLFGELEGSL